MKKNLRSFNAILAAFLLAGILPSAHALIITERVTVVCGPTCLGAMARREVEMMQQFDDLNALWRGANSGRTQHSYLNDDATMLWAGVMSDARCNPEAKAAQNVIKPNLNAGDTYSNQKYGAEATWTVIKDTLNNNTTQINTFVNGLPAQSGTYAVSGASFTNQKILPVIWNDGTQTNVTLVNNGSTWVVGNVVSTKAKPPGESVGQCPG